MNKYKVNLPAFVENKIKQNYIEICCHTIDNSVQSMLQAAQYEPHVQILLSQFCVNKNRILDIGANYGQHTVLMSKLNPTSTIVAIEASSNNIEVLEETLKSNNINNVKIKNCYLLDKEKDFTFYHEDGNAACAFGCSSDYGNKNHADISSKITTETLDNVIDFIPDFIKMDIEGAELLAIKGGENIFKHNPDLLIELNKFTCKEFFNSPINLLIEEIYNIGYTKALIYNNNNILYISKETIINIMENNTICEVLFQK